MEKFEHIDQSALRDAYVELDAVQADVEALLKSLSDADAALCTCSTLGPLADNAARLSLVSYCLLARSHHVHSRRSDAHDERRLWELDLKTEDCPITHAVSP